MEQKGIIFKISLALFMCVRETQRTHMLRGQLWVLGIKLRSGFYSKHLYPVSHLAGPQKRNIHGKTDKLDKTFITLAFENLFI